MNLVHCQKQLEEGHQHYLNKIMFVKIIFINLLRFLKTHEDVNRAGAKGELMATPSQFDYKTYC